MDVDDKEKKKKKKQRGSVDGRQRSDGVEFGSCRESERERVGVEGDIVHNTVNALVYYKA